MSELQKMAAGLTAQHQLAPQLYPNVQEDYDEHSPSEVSSEADAASEAGSDEDNDLQVAPEGFYEAHERKAPLLKQSPVISDITQTALLLQLLQSKSRVSWTIDEDVGRPAKRART